MKTRRGTTSSTLVTALAAALTTACGGGGENPNLRPEAPEATHAAVSARIERANTHAADLADHWTGADRLLEGLGPVAEGDPTEGLAAAIAGYDGAAPAGVTSLRAAGAHNVRAVGTRHGVTVGGWTSGPVGTMDIELYYDPSADVNDAEKATIERAAKAWSRYIRTEFDDRTVEAGTVVDKRAFPPTRLHADVEVDDLLVVVSTTTEGTLSHGGSTGSSFRGDAFTPGTGFIHMNTARGHLQDNQVIVHEIGHALLYTEPTREGVRTPTRERFLSAEGTHFEGPEAMQANGGQPVPFQWVNAQNEPVAPGTPGAMVDPGHIGVCTSVMAYCADDDVVMPSALDIAWLRDMGYETYDEATALAPEVYGYGAWGRYSAWGVGVARTLTGFDAASDRLEAGAEAFGVVPETAFEDAARASGLTGSVTWRGVLVGADIASEGLAPVTGDARLALDLATFEGTAGFENLRVHEDGETSDFRATALEYAISVEGNGFADADRRVDGAFYGPGHEEMAGVVNDGRSSVNLLGAFGGTKEE